MAASLPMSAHGLQVIDAHRKIKGWNKLDEDWAEQAGISTTTLRRFWEGRRIWQTHIKAICQAVGVENWEALIAVEMPVTVQSSEAHQDQNRGDQPAHRTFDARPVTLGSQLYIERPPIESNCYEGIREPGALIRIKALRQMGKTSLANRILAQAVLENYRTVRLNLRWAEQPVLSDIDKFLRWFCANITQQLHVKLKLDEFWDEELMGSLVSCTTYFQAYLLEQINTPLILVLDEVDRVFEYPDIAQDFFPLLRSWYEEANILDIWKKLRLIVVHSTEIYVPLNINQSPFNVGLPVELPEFTLEQIADLAQRYKLDWTEHQLQLLISMLGGHPFLVQMALHSVSHQNLVLEQLLRSAPTESGIFREHLRRHLIQLQQNPALAAAFKQVISANSGIQLEPLQIYQLQSMGLVKLDGSDVLPRCNLYCQYFQKTLV